MKTINYKGKGEHSVRELELIIKQQAEELHLLKSGQKQLPIHGVVKSLPTSKEMTDVVSDISIQAKRSNDELDIASYGIGFIDGYRWTVENSEK